MNDEQWNGTKHQFFKCRLQYVADIIQTSVRFVLSLYATLRWLPVGDRASNWIRIPGDSNDRKSNG